MFLKEAFIEYLTPCTAAVAVIGRDDHSYPCQSDSIVDEEDELSHLPQPTTKLCSVVFTSRQSVESS